jgi:hypothetical protein
VFQSFGRNGLLGKFASMLKLFVLKNALGRGRQIFLALSGSSICVVMFLKEK